MTTARPPDETHIQLDPNTCEVMEGHQHKATDIADLAQSISLLGQINPIQVIQKTDGRHLIAAGRRRWMACKELGCPVVANVWHAAEDDLDLELYGRSVRIAENLERKEPAAIDIAKQLRSIRSERGYSNAELSEHVGMSQRAVQHYLSFFQASDYLQDLAQEHAFSLTVMLELVQCEKQFAVRKSKALAAQVVKGELTTSDLRRMRKGKKPSQAKPQRKARGSQTDLLRTSSDAFLKLAASSPAAERACLEQHMQALAAILSSPASDEATTEI